MKFSFYSFLIIVNILQTTNFPSQISSLSEDLKKENDSAEQIMCWISSLFACAMVYSHSVI